MLSIVNTWGRIQQVLLSHSDHWFLFSQPHEDALTPGPPENKAKVTLRTRIHWYTASTRQGNLFPNEVLLSCEGVALRDWVCPLY